jgi:hypothetical protein
MRKHLYISFLAVLTSVKPSFACYPDPQFEYDEVSSQTASIATATVTAVDLESDDSQSCWHVSYSNAKYLFGNGENDFSISTCVHEIYQIDLLAEEDEGLDYLGFVQGAEVLIGLVQNNENPSGLRYAIPSCWGPLHINLSKLSREERDDFLQDIQSQITNGQ